MTSFNDISFLSVNENGLLVGESKSGLKSIEGISFLDKNANHIIHNYRREGPIEKVHNEFCNRLFWKCLKI